MSTTGSAARVRVVMPAWNAAATIAESVASVLDQTHRNLTLVVVDDGSIDGTADAARQAFDGRCRLVHQPNAGPAAARNRGAEGATETYLAFVDADDVWRPGKLEAQLAAIEAAAGAEVAYGWVDVVDADLNVVCPDLRADAAGDVYQALLRRNFIYSGSNSLITRSAFEKVGGFDARLWGAEDWELHCRLARRFAFAVATEVVVAYRQSPRSLTGDLTAMADAYGMASETVFEVAPPDLQSLRAESDAAFWFYLAGQASQTGRAGDLARAGRFGLRAVRASAPITLALLRASSPA
ncbi:MAG: glycosyltransferase family 2 protein, partial [Acidimicrobiales bacterium]|nr:glycosyltransferase family 2 protein [Acidimicrobiales bacterium]